MCCICRSFSNGANYARDLLNIGTNVITFELKL